MTSPTPTGEVSAFDPNWPHGHVTRDGHKAKLIYSGLKNVQPFVFVITGTDGTEFATEHSPDGTYNLRRQSAFDLFNAPAPVEVAA